MQAGLLIAVLAVVAFAEAAAVVVLLVRLRAREAELEEAREAARFRLADAVAGAVPSGALGPRAAQAAQAARAAGLAVRTVVETASRLREEGVRGTVLGSIDELTAWAMEHRPEIARIAAPDGTVTIMFSDIEGSTALNSELGDEQWVKLLASHDRLLHTFVEKHGGQIVKNQGDGYMVVFSSCGQAVDAALDIQRALGVRRHRNRRLRRTPIRVRIGLHTGTAIEREGDYFGRNVAMAARVAALADGGEILVTSEVAEALAEREDLSFVEEDTVELKGLPGEHRLWLVEAR